MKTIHTSILCHEDTSYSQCTGRKTSNICPRENPAAHHNPERSPYNREREHKRALSDWFSGGKAKGRAPLFYAKDVGRRRAIQYQVLDPYTHCCIVRHTHTHWTNSHSLEVTQYETHHRIETFAPGFLLCGGHHTFPVAEFSRERSPDRGEFLQFTVYL